jgi:predicted tellurium resistance membrane protein TerC
MSFRFGSSGAGAFLGCGGLLAVFGLVLLTPVGVWLVKALGWISIVLGIIFVVTGIFNWLSGNRRRYF